MRFDNQNTQMLQVDGEQNLSSERTMSTILSLARVEMPAPAVHPGSLIGEDPAPLLFGQRDTPEIPGSILPSWAGEFAAELAESSQTPPAMVVMLTLSAIATCVAKRYAVCANDSFVEPLNIWTAPVSDSGSGKTHVLSAATEPLTEWEYRQEKKIGPEVRRTNNLHRIAKKRIRHLESLAAKCSNLNDIKTIMKEIEQLESDLDKPVTLPKLWTADVTPARLQMLLVENGERMAMISDEGGVFEVMAGLYSGGRANTDVFLQSHAGRAVRVDRMGRQVTLDAPALTFGLTIQPDILSRMQENGRHHFRGNGTLARFLFVVPRSTVGHRDVRAYRSVSTEVLARYRDGLYSLLSVPQQTVNGREIPRHLKLSPQAMEAWQVFAQEIEQRMADGSDLEHLRDWGGKLPGAVLRIAGIFHLVENEIAPEKKTIAETTMERAIQLGALLIDHAQVAFAMMESNQATTDAEAIYEWIIQKRLRHFKTGDLWARFKSRFTGKRERVNGALKELTERKIVTSTSEKTAGRPATVYYVNSRILPMIDSQ